MYKFEREKQPEKQPETSKTVEIEERAEKIFDYLKHNMTASRGKIAAALDLTETQVRTAIALLKKNGRIYHEGAARGGYWVVKD